MKRVVLFASLTLPLVSPASVLAQPSLVDVYVEQYLREANVPGLSLAIVQDRELVKAQGYGLANVEHSVPSGPDTIYQSGSLGKQFTATAIMMLVEEGRIRLDEPIVRFFPEGANEWKGITVRHLLTHTSGIANYTGGAVDYRRDYGEEELVRLAASLPPDFAPGEEFRYSNTGYVLLGALIRRVTGQFYGDFLHDRIFAPLGMTTARVISEADIIPHRAAGYRLVDGEIKNQSWVSPTLNTTADGALYLTVLDLAKWAQALDSERLLRRSSFDQMWTRARLNDGSSVDYGFGWRLAELGSHRVIEHGGAWQGFTTHISRYPDDSLTVIVLTNRSGASPDEVAHHVAGLMRPGLKPSPTGGK